MTEVTEVASSLEVVPFSEQSAEAVDLRIRNSRKKAKRSSEEHEQSQIALGLDNLKAGTYVLLSYVRLL
jgi:hypothetical protein